VTRSPRIAFASTAVAVKRRDAAAADLMVTGQLTIRDVTRPVGVPVHVELTPTGLAAAGRFAVKQSEFGIKPVSVAGVVSVKDTLEVALSIVARR
jgi:polyisoprenoid-binding protein YceI